MDRAAPPAVIIVALDGRPSTERILGPAKDLARLYGATMVLVRAIDREQLPAEDDPNTAPSVAMLVGPAADGTSGLEIPVAGAIASESYTPARPLDNPEAAGYLNILDHTLEAEGFRVEHIDPDDNPAEAIVAEARARSARLIIMGTRQRKGWDRLFKGSTAEKVLRESPCPVLVVPLD